MQPRRDPHDGPDTDPRWRTHADSHRDRTPPCADRVLLAHRTDHVLRARGQRRLLRIRRDRRWRLRLPLSGAPIHTETEMNQRSSTSPELHVAWDQVRAQLRALIGRRVGDPEAVEDLVQDVLLRFTTAAAGGEQFRSLPAWLGRVARNAVIDYYRTRRRQEPLEESSERADPSAWPYPDNADDSGVRELAQCLRPLIEQLPTMARDALVLTDLDGLTQAAAAAELGLSISGMKSRVQRARLQLRALLIACCPVTIDRRGAIIDVAPSTASCACASVASASS